jgi:hypothetical protein
MTSPAQTPFLELQKQLWKARAQAKQKWLEQSLAEPTSAPDDAAWRMTWIKQALNMVKRSQADIQQHAALLDAYTEHLTVLEMTLMAAAEEKRSNDAAANPGVEAPEQKRSAAADSRADTALSAGARSGDSLKRRNV